MRGVRAARRAAYIQKPPSLEGGFVALAVVVVTVVTNFLAFAEQQAYTPNSGKSDNRIYDPRCRCGSSAEHMRDKIVSENSNASKG
jgi:hypothetical protein